MVKILTCESMRKTYEASYAFSDAHVYFFSNKLTVIDFDL